MLSMILASQIINNIEKECKTLISMKNETQTKGKTHENIVKNVLEKHGIKNLKETDCFKNCEEHKSKEIIKKIIEKDEHFSDVLPGFYYYNQLWGQQNPPDFVLFNIEKNKTKIIKLECKSGSCIMWNDSFPSLNTLYIFTQTISRNINTILFTGNDDCKLAMYGPDLLSINNEFEFEVTELRKKYTKKLKEVCESAGHKINYSTVKQYARLNRAQSNFPKPELCKSFFKTSLEEFLICDDVEYVNLVSILENLSLI